MIVVPPKKEQVTYVVLGKHVVTIAARSKRTVGQS